MKGIAVILMIGGLLLAGSAYADSLSLSQNRVDLLSGQSTAVYIYGGSGSYSVTNSNDTAVGAVVSGSTLNLYGINPGSSALNVCSSTGGCIGLYVNVSANLIGGVSLNPTSLTLVAGQTGTASVGSGIYQNTYSISGNSDPNVATATLSGTTITIYANSMGTTAIAVSGASGGSATLYVTVTQNYQNLSLSQTSVSVNQGSSVSVYAYNNYGSLYVGSNTNPNVASVSINNNQISIYGNAAGTSSIQICATGYNQCANLYVTVNQTYYGLNFTNIYPPQATVGQYYTYSFGASGGVPAYTFSVASGTLAPGLVLLGGGQLYGTPTSSGTYSFALRVYDSAGHSGMSPTITLQVGNVLGATTYGNGTLMLDGGTIYIIYKNTKTGFANWDAFSGLGYKMSNVFMGSTWSQSLREVVNSRYSAHPAGSWIISGQTVYFVHEQGLIPVPNYNVFINNGGFDVWLAAANQYDFAKPMLPMMVNYDSRLR